jgi:hypothetical protein
MPSETVTALRKQLREKFPAAHKGEQGHSCAAIPTPQHEVPQTPWHFELGTWHFPKGAITEISPADPSCGLSLIIAALLSETLESGSTVPLVLIDARDRFDPASFTPEECARLLWLRCRDTNQAIRSADLLLRDGNLPFVLLDLSALPARELRRIPNSSWHRLRQLAQSTDTTFLALTPTPLIPRTTLRLTLTRQFTLHDLHLSRPELLATLQTETTRHLHQTA